jgi:hypothetical protein
MTELFQRIYDTGLMPTVWKKANITALHKKGDKSDSKNYRPISLTCIVSKVYEKILRNHILQFVQPFISKQQHGFLPRVSCLSNLLECLDTVYGIIEEDKCADVIYLDFQKAFDSVPHKRLTAKLEAYGITGKMLRVIEDFLTERTFRVRVGGTYSRWFKVTSGVPQGTVLGPLLFLIYINDLPDEIKCFVSLFADDVKMVTRCNEFSLAQKDLQKLEEWQKKWLLTFNTIDNKCKVLHIGKCNPINQYFMNDLALPTVPTEKDLGVHMDTHLDWSLHIQKSINKASSVLGWLSRNVISRDKAVIMNIYKSLIRPHLEYAVQLWNPPAQHGNWGTIMELEKVQRSVTRMIKGIGLLPYEERLEKLNITTLLERRYRGDLIETFKMVKDNAPYGEGLFKISRSGYNIVKKPGKRNFLPNRIADYWNKIPDIIKDAPSVNSFKSRLEHYKKEKKSEEALGHYWEVSDQLMSRINNTDRETYVTFMREHPAISKRKNTNIH